MQVSGMNKALHLFSHAGAPQVLRYSVAKKVEAISGRDVRLEMEVCYLRQVPISQLQKGQSLWCPLTNGL